MAETALIFTPITLLPSPSPPPDIYPYLCIHLFRQPSLFNSYLSLLNVSLLQSLPGCIYACTVWVASPWGFSEMTIQPARHECHACCPLQAEKPGIQPVVGNTDGTHVEQVISSFQKILRGSQLTWYLPLPAHLAFSFTSLRPPSPVLFVLTFTCTLTFIFTYGPFTHPYPYIYYFFHL